MKTTKTNTQENATEVKNVVSFATTTDKGFKDVYKAFTELAKAYVNTNEIKTNKSNICEALNVDFKAYKMLLAEYRTNVLSNLTDEQKAAKEAAKSFESALNAAFAAAQTSEAFGSKIAKIRKDNRDFSVMQFVRDYYRYISVSGDILVQSSNYYTNSRNLLHKVTTLETISDKQATPAKAYSVIVNCIDNYYLQAKKAYINKDFALNRYTAGVITQVFAYDSKADKFNKIDKIDLSGLQAVSFEDAKELRK